MEFSGLFGPQVDSRNFQKRGGWVPYCKSFSGSSEVDNFTRKKIKFGPKPVKNKSRSKNYELHSYQFTEPFFYSEKK